MEAAANAQDKRVEIRVRADRRMLMLRVENSFADAPTEKRGMFATMKENAEAHGFGIRGMHEIAARYSGTLDTKVIGNRFELVACLMFQVPSESET